MHRQCGCIGKTEHESPTDREPRPRVTPGSRRYDAGEPRDTLRCDETDDHRHGNRPVFTLAGTGVSDRPCARREDRRRVRVAARDSTGEEKVVARVVYAPVALPKRAIGTQS